MRQDLNVDAGFVHLFKAQLAKRHAFADARRFHRVRPGESRLDLRVAIMFFQGNDQWLRHLRLSMGDFLRAQSTTLPLREGRNF